MTLLLRLPMLAVPLVALAACNQADESLAPGGGKAEGEVLGGTISDDMIPLDQLRSQSPPMRAAPGAGGSDTGGASAAVADGETGAADEPAPAETGPAAEPGAGE